MTDPVVHYEQRETVAWIRLDDGKANALGLGTLEQLGAALDRASAEAKAVVIGGREGRFSAGFDLKVMMSGMEQARGLVLEGGHLLMRLYEHPQPVVVACTGHAIAAGVLVVACGDLRIGAAGDFRLGLNEVGNGMPVPILAHELARDRLDPRAFTEAVLHARLYGPEDAREAGWLDRVVPAAELERVALEEARRLGQLPSMPYAATKRSMRRRTIAHVRDTLESNMDEFAVGA